MSQAKGFSDKVAFIWAVADLLRGDFKAHEYGQVILPFVVLRRLECALAPTKDAVIKRAAAVSGKYDNVEPLLLHESGQRFYNTSPLDLTSILQDPPNCVANLRTYLASFSPGAHEVLERYGLEDKINRLDKAGLLYQVVGKFAELDLTTKTVSNDAMGYIFEELLRRFSEMSNETAGEHFTPREVIRLMVNVLLAPDGKALAGQKPIRTIYDPACGTGGMLTIAQEHLATMNPNAELVAYGQELNPETWAICRSDLMIKGQDPALIALGNSLILGDQEHPGDGHAGDHFDYLLANPPFGVDWNKYADPVRDEHTKRGFDGRYGPGLPRVSDGSMLFLLHMISKFKPVADDPSTPDIIEGGSRMGIVFSASPLFAGNAGGGESEIRRFILENDLLEGIIALPNEMFYNTGINTYIWFLTNRKAPERAGKIVLLDGRDMYMKMARSLGDKRKTISDSQIAEITTLYAEALDREDSRLRVLAREELGFARLAVERPLRRAWRIGGHLYTTEVSAKAAVKAAEPTAAAAQVNAAVKAAAFDDPTAEPVPGGKTGQYKADADLRDYESIPLPPGYLTMSAEEQVSRVRADAERHLLEQVHPYEPLAWVDHSKTKIGYEVPLTRLFYSYNPRQSVAECAADIVSSQKELIELIEGLAH